MAPPGVCPQCGDRLPADVPHGICPKCLLSLGFGEPDKGTERAFQPTQEPGRRFTPPPPAELAAHFPQLEILELLGQGGMGAVYRARQKTLDRIVALKVLPPEVGQDPAFAERFTREAQALARLTHPNIVMVFEIGESDGYYFFIMEYVDGVNLRQSLQAGRLTPEQALAIVPQVCEALQYAHDQGIVHRDIKPENVLLDKRGRVKIADFGLAKLLGRPGGRWSLTGTGQVMGTLHYMAPEQVEKPLTVDHRADIYSLGVVFYELLTGELPLGRFAPPSQKTNVSADLDQVVLRTLEKEPDRRYQHASDVKTAVESLGSGPSAPARSAAAQGLLRLRVPFSIDSAYAGLAKVDGIVRFDGRELTLEFQVKDGMFGVVTSGVKHVTVPLTELVSLDWEPGWFGRKARLELRTDKLDTLHSVPQSERGIARLRIARDDIASAQQLVGAVGHTAAVPAVAVDAMATPATVKPPLPSEDVRWNKVVHSVRGPAIGLTIVGILDCFAILLMLLLVPVMTAWSGPSQPHAPPVVFYQAQDPASGESVTVTGEGITVRSGNETFQMAQPTRASLLILALMGLVPLAFVVMMMIGAARMKRLQTYGLAMTAAIFAVLPAHPAFVLGLPIGIWALVVLLRQDTREAFRLREQYGPAVLTPGWTIAEAARPLPVKPAPYVASGASDGLRIPAKGLLIVGTLNVAGSAVMVLKAVTAHGVFTFPLVLFMLPLIAGVLQLKGGWHMLNRRSYSASMLGVVAALLPITPLWFVGLPLGIWALIVLQRPGMRDLFADGGEGAYVAPGHRGTSRHTGCWPVVTIVVLLLLVLSVPVVALLGYLFVHQRTRQVHSLESATTNVWTAPEMPEAPILPQLPSDAMISPAGPETPEMEIPQRFERY